MTAVRIATSSEFDASVSDLWRFHMQEEALDVLAPPFSGFRLRSRGEGVQDDSIAEFSIGWRPFVQRWVALHCGVQEEHSFTDIALDAPVPFWVHVHSFEELSEVRSRLTDTVWFEPPSWMPRAIAARLMNLSIRVFFWWRHRVTAKWLARNAGSTPGLIDRGQAIPIGGLS